MENGNRKVPALPEPDVVKAENKRLAVQFKAQHGLVVAFFLLLLYVSSDAIQFIN